MTLRATRESQLAGAPCTVEDTEEIFWLREADDYASRLALGGALAAQYRYREAVAAYEEAARIRADDAALWLRLGGARLTIRRFDEADAAYTRARALGASEGATAIPTGFRYYLQSDWRAAAASFARGLPAPDETAVAVLYWHTLSCARDGAPPSLLEQLNPSISSFSPTALPSGATAAARRSADARCAKRSSRGKMSGRAWRRSPPTAIVSTHRRWTERRLHGSSS